MTAPESRCRAAALSSVRCAWATMGREEGVCLPFKGLSHLGQIRRCARAAMQRGKRGFIPSCLVFSGLCSEYQALKRLLRTEPRATTRGRTGANLRTRPNLRGVALNAPDCLANLSNRVRR
jgi:hypothetical protein